MRLKTVPKEVASELLTYIAEKEDFEAVVKSLGDEVSGLDIKALLREIALELKKEAASEGERYDIKRCRHLSKNAKRIISYLSPHEEKTLLNAFGLTEGGLKSQSLKKQEVS